MKNLTETEADRFQGKFKVSGNCWLWTGPLDRDGYGTFYFRGASRRAHRVAWYSVHGEVPNDFVVNHTCRNRSCVNPQHLQCISASENALKDSASIPYINSQKTHCRNGHPFDKAITWRGKTQRICSICDRARRSEAARVRRQKAKAALRV